MDTTLTRKNMYMILYVFFLVGIAGHFTGEYFSLMITLTPYILLSMGIFVLIFSGVLRSKQFIQWFIITYIVTFLLEVTGVHTGKIFGVYTYGDVLGLKLFGVPLIIGFNWLFVIAGAVSLSSIIFRNVFIVILSSAILSVIFDYLLEPVAMNLGYWNWENGIIPVQNYVAWFLISFTASSVLMYFKHKGNSEYNFIKFSNLFMHYFIAQIIFFTALNFR